ncbi:MAG: carboxypeptidase-like regulatory domain-containing protein [Bacteroidetes bacterium]|nr:carboxypeptidase-like regulatory domain-containing protein [Bacteroidota bacterium]
MRKDLLSVTLLLILSASLSAQQRIAGVVRDADSGDPLQFANVWVKGSHKGTTSDRDGRFTLSLDAGEHTIVVSYIGYVSETRKIRIPGDSEYAFSLRQQSIEMPTVEVTPDDNPALRIIRRAIEAKKERLELLQNYSLTSHSKLRLRIRGALEEMSSRGDGVSVRLTFGGSDDDSTAAKQDSTQLLPILLETQTDAWWAKPDRYKEVVRARKQSAMVPAQANFIISAFFIIDFSADDLSFGQGVPLAGPISERGLDSYYYRLVGETMLDSTRIYQIDLSPLSSRQPLLEGTIYIADSTFSLSMVDVRLNDAALPQFFESLAFKQNFRLFDSNFWMPVDVVVDADIQIPLIGIGVGIEGFSVLQDYRINQEINEDFFDRTVIKVLKEADDRDSTYWAVNRMIPNTEEEERAYLRADTVKMQLDSLQYSVGFGDIVLGGMTGSDVAQFSFPGIIPLYRFNRVEGNALDGDFRLTLPDFPLRRVFAGGGYGFSDERWKYRFGGSVSLFDSPVLRISGSRYFERDFIDSNNDPAGEDLVTLFNLFAKYDYRDYHYRDGWQVALQYDPFLLFPMSVELRDDRFLNASKNSDWSILRQSWRYRENPPINEGRIRSVTATLSFDNRDVIDNAGRIMRFGARNHIPMLFAGQHDVDIDGRTWNILTAGGRLSGQFDLGFLGELSYSLAGDYADGALPTQLLFNLQGSMDWLAWTDRFRTLDFREFGGDRLATAKFTFNFRDWLFRASALPLLKDSGWMLTLFASGGWTQMSEATHTLQTVDVAETGNMFWEAGFRVSNIFSFLNIDLAWRLNHFREGRNFHLGLGIGM